MRCATAANARLDEPRNSVVVWVVTTLQRIPACVRREAGPRGMHHVECVKSLPTHRQYRNLYHSRMKTTLNLNDQLLADAKALAAQQRTSLTRLIEEGLQLRLRANANSAKRARVRLPVFKGRGGLVKGVDPLSNKALLDALGDDA
jgi:hypothetical protein